MRAIRIQLKAERSNDSAYLHLAPVYPFLKLASVGPRLHAFGYLGSSSATTPIEPEVRITLKVITVRPARRTVPRVLDVMSAGNSFGCTKFHVSLMGWTSKSVAKHQNFGTCCHVFAGDETS